MTCEDRVIAGGLLSEQATAAAVRTGDARLLAGPGTGKTRTLVEFVANLVRGGVSSSDILCVTFTRAAAAGMRRKIAATLGKAGTPPEVYTLHAFALKVLMERRVDVGSGKGRARVADDWEERWIVEEDLKRLLREAKITSVRARLKALAAAWETEPGIPPKVDPPLLGALMRDKERYRYVLRSELVFLLHDELGADPDLLRGAYKHIVVDEYQDLNKCDVAVLDELGRRGASLYVAGDDDQSIYQQLRHAHPDAIRNFTAVHAGATDLSLSVCVRCDREIIRLATEVISQEVGRLRKVLGPYPTAGPGLVEILSFPGQVAEANGIASLTRKFVDAGVPYDGILLLLRSDWQKRFSDVLLDAMNRAGVPARVRTPEKSALDTTAGRSLLAHLRLIVDRNDSLAMRTALEQGRNRVGKSKIDEIDSLADGSSESFSEAVARVIADPSRITGGAAVKSAAEEIGRRVSAVEASAPTDVDTYINAMAAELPASADLIAAVGELVILASTFLLAELGEFLNAVAMGVDEEQDLVPNTVNIMTMHKAKGLDACVVFIPAAEQEIIPGDRGGVDEARRLFYVSLTRAKRALFITHAVRRTGRQAYSGVPGRDHSRTSFLRTRGRSTPGRDFVSKFVVDARYLAPRDPFAEPPTSARRRALNE